MGGTAIDETGEPLPDATLAACRAADAVLLGAVGGPKWDDPSRQGRPEQGLLGAAARLGLYANLGRSRRYPALAEALAAQARDGSRASISWSCAS